MTTRQYARLVSAWIASIGLDPLKFGRTGLEAHEAGRQIDKSAHQLAARYRDGAAFIEADEVESVLADVEADGSDWIG